MDYILQKSSRNPALIFGDTNSRYTRKGDNVRTILKRGGFTDAWVSLIRDGVLPVEGAAAEVCDNPSTTTRCEIVDKVFFKSGRNVKLDAVAFEYASAQFLSKNGSILSDHNPIAVQLDWTSA